jgi:NAD+ synthase
MLQALEINCVTECERIVAFLREQLAQARHTRLVVGMSGGIDSALVAALGALAIGAENVVGMMLPYRTSNPQSEAHARLAIHALGMAWERFEISDMVDALVNAYPGMSAGRKGNTMARCRMIALFDQSVAHNALVAGTSNRTETLLGYFTLHGDGAAALKPIAHLYKCQVRALAAYVGVPEPIITKAPSADLWDGQTDEGELGFGYDEADQILYLLTERQLDEASVAAFGFDARVVRAVRSRMLASEFKRCWPPCLAPENPCI